MQKPNRTSLSANVEYLKVENLIDFLKNLDKGS
jgi:hypothetical protein